MNKSTIIGNLTADPELRTTPEGKNVCNFTVAVNRRRANADGEREADFFRVSVWNERADLCAKYLQKGNAIVVIQKTMFVKFLLETS